MINSCPRQLYLTLLSVSLLTIAGHPGFAQPFGIAEGTPTVQLNVVKETGPFTYLIRPNASHPDFEFYSALSTPESGVCKLLASGFTLANDAYGTQVISLFEILTEQLTLKYGNSRKFDYLRSGSIWNEPRDWAMSIHKNERVYARFWNKEEHSSLQYGLQSIQLKVEALGADQTYVIISYEYNNLDKCAAKRKTASAGAL